MNSYGGVGRVEGRGECVRGHVLPAVRMCNNDNQSHLAEAGTPALQVGA